MMEMFHRTLTDGHEIKLPRFENIPPALLRQTHKLSAESRVWSILEHYLSDEDLRHFDATIGQSSSQFESFIQEWQKSSSVTVGESSAS